MHIVCPSVQVKPLQTPPRTPQVPSVSKVTQVTPMSPVAVPIRTRMATRQQTSTYFEDEDEDMTELQPTFSGPIIKSVTVGGRAGRWRGRGHGLSVTVLALSVFQIDGVPSSSSQRWHIGHQRRPPLP